MTDATAKPREGEKWNKVLLMKMTPALGGRKVETYN